MRLGPPPRIITFFFGVCLDLVVAAVVGGIIIRRVSLELGGAGVHEPVARHEVQFLPQRADFVLGLAGQMGDLPVGEPQPFRFAQQFRI